MKLEQMMNAILEQVRKEYQAMHWLDLAQAAKEMGIELTGKSPAEVIDELMALEEHACFH
jgi:hypothetical protein